MRSGLKEAKSLGKFGDTWFEKEPMADSTRAMRRSIWNRELEPVAQPSPDRDPTALYGARHAAHRLDLTELGFNSDWIEKCLAHEDGRSSRGVYNKAEYESQRRHMMQEWSDILEAWAAGKSRAPVPIPSAARLLVPDPSLEAAFA